MNYEYVLIQIVIGSFIGLAIVKLFQTNKSINYEKRISKYALDSSANDFSFFDQVFLFLYGLIKSIAKYINKFKYFQKKANKYDKYITYDYNNIYQSIDFLAIKYLIFLVLTLINIFMSLVRIKKIEYIPTIIIALFGYYLLDILLKIYYKRKKAIIENDLLKAIMIMNNAFAGGSNIIKAIELVTKELDGGIQDEFKKILKDLKFGLDVSMAFNRFYNRIELEDAKYISVSLTLLNKTGGNIASIFSLIEETIMSRRELKKELKTITAASKLTYRILAIIPTFITLIIMMINTNYFLPLINSPLGIIIILIIVILYLSYILIIKKVLKVDNIWKIKI